MNAQEFKAMVDSARDNWILNVDTDPRGYVARGLDVLSRETDEEVINARMKGTDDWDGLMEWAELMGQK